MTATRGLALILTVAAAGALVKASGPAAGTPTVQLKTISARTNGSGASLVIEASEPVAYSLTRPDALTVLVDFRNVTHDAVANTVAANGKNAIARVSVEDGESLGAPTARVRIALAQPVAHHARSDRNTVVIDFDKPSAKTPPYVTPPKGGDSGVGSRESPITRAGAVDAMDALRQTMAADPIAALGLNGGPSTAPRAPQGSPEPPAPAPARAVAPAPAPRAAAAPQPVTPPAPVQPPTIEQPGTKGKQYSGHPISLDFQGADLRAVLRTFAEISGLNVVIDPAVTGSVDVALRDVPWDQALDIILRANKLGYMVDGTIVRIAPLATLAAEEKERADLAKAQADAGQVTTLTRQLSYAKGEEMVTLLKQANVLSNRGQAFVDTRTNTLIVTDLADRLTATTELISTIDRPQPQVEIEARIVQTNKNYARQLGVQWGFNGRVDPALGNTTNLAFPNNGRLNGATGVSQNVPAGQQPNGSSPNAVNLGVPGATTAVGLALGAVNGSFNLDVALSALESTGNGRLLSTPRVTTQNNVAAEMTQGVQIPIQTVANNTVTVSFKDAALTLKVTPQITAANTVIMQIALENASPDFSRAVNNIPPINTQRAITQVLVSDGQTTVIGGIFVSQEQAQTDRTPGLGQIPLIKWLFKRDTVSDQNTELLVFITPRIIKS
ncbi:MAG TPA: type IV pilus secretin PilQ [Vicinamibacterales bacterium]|nr:type IV pilus secretin PilQ [Vicinamibacterales bacterium]